MKTIDNKSVLQIVEINSQPTMNLLKSGESEKSLQKPTRFLIKFPEKASSSNFLYILCNNKMIHKNNNRKLLKIALKVKKTLIKILLRIKILLINQILARDFRKCSLRDNQNKPRNLKTNPYLHQLIKREHQYQCSKRNKVSMKER